MESNRFGVVGCFEGCINQASVSDRPSKKPTEATTLISTEGSWFHNTMKYP